MLRPKFRISFRVLGKKKPGAEEREQDWILVSTWNIWGFFLLLKVEKKGRDSQIFSELSGSKKKKSNVSNLAAINQVEHFFKY